MPADLEGCINVLDAGPDISQAVMRTPWLPFLAVHQIIMQHLHVEASALPSYMSLAIQIQLSYSGNGQDDRC